MLIVDDNDDLIVNKNEYVVLELDLETVQNRIHKIMGKDIEHNEDTIKLKQEIKEEIFEFELGEPREPDYGNIIKRKKNWKKNKFYE